MATARRMKAPLEQPVEKELKLVFVAAVGPQAPAVTVLAFVPMLLTSIGYRELNKADPDYGTTFTWATRAFGPRSGWAGWAIIVADVLVLASLAQVAGPYVFFLFNADGSRRRMQSRHEAGHKSHPGIGGSHTMAKALLGYIGGPDPRMLAEMRRLQQQIRDLESELVRLHEENDVLSAEVGKRQVTQVGPPVRPQRAQHRRIPAPQNSLLCTATTTESPHQKLPRSAVPVRVPAPDVGHPLPHPAAYPGRTAWPRAVFRREQGDGNDKDAAARPLTFRIGDDHRAPGDPYSAVCQRGASTRIASRFTLCSYRNPPAGRPRPRERWPRSFGCGTR
jgi:hypothetical protein